MTTTINASLDFLGGVDIVIGSRFVVHTGQSDFLLDCRLFQGERELRERNCQG